MTDRTAARVIRKLRLLAVLALSLILCSCGIVPQTPLDLALAPETSVPESLGVIIFVDAFDIGVFRELQAQGRLPNITRYLIEGGVTVQDAVGSYPSTTYANSVSFVTGLFPGHHHIVGNRWFDRQDLILQDYSYVRSYLEVDEDLSHPTIYELLPEDFTATILTPIRRGATISYDDPEIVGAAWYLGYHSTINRLVAARFESIARQADRLGRWPTLILAYFVTPDTMTHEKGPSHPDYVEMLVDIDQRVGDICVMLEQAGLLERTYITLTSDHGAVDTPEYVDIARFFARTLGVTVRDRRFGRNVSLDRRLAHFGPVRVVVLPSGTRRCAIHLRAGAHWWQRPSEEHIDAFARMFTEKPPAGAQWPDLPEMLTALPAVDVAVIRLGPDSVRVQNSHGISVIDRVVEDGVKRYRYRVRQGADPLGYEAWPAAAALMDGGHHDGDAWLAATRATDRPDAVVQLIELNDSPRAGDINLYARRGWSFTDDEAGGHGGLKREEFIVPWLWAGPSLPAGARTNGARTVDLTPTMLDLLGHGRAIPGGLDGRSIADRLRSVTAAPENPADN